MGAGKHLRRRCRIFEEVCCARAGDAEDVTSARAGGVPLRKLESAGIPLRESESAGISLRELESAGISLKEPNRG